MQRGKKIAAATVMLGLGFAFAMLFRRTDPPATTTPPGPPAPQKEALVLRESGVNPLGHMLSQNVVPLKPAQGAKPPRDLDAPIAAPKRPVAPPELPTNFDRSLAAAPAQDPRGVEALAKLNALTRYSVADTIPQGPPPLRVHKIVDGDTLAQLAERFLGNAQRSAEIYSLNAAQLADPNLLPIGVELKIPPRNGALVVQTNKPVVSAPAESESPWRTNPLRPDPLHSLDDTSGLVPVPAGQPH